jgi:hypothetical protein
MGNNKHKFTKAGNKLMENGKVIITMPSKIITYIIIDDFLILLVSPKNNIDDRNIYGFDLRGNLKWQIPQPDKLHSENHYISVSLSSGYLRAYNINGIEVTISVEDGHIITKELIK